MLHCSLSACNKADRSPKELALNLVDISDAEFILSLRLDKKRAIYLSETAPSLEKQVEWINAYKAREKAGLEYYYLASEDGKKVGTVRIYNINRFSCTGGSWLFNRSVSSNSAILCDIMINDLIFNDLNRNIVLFDVCKNNKRVISYHELKNPVFYFEDDVKYYMMLTRSAWYDARRRIFEFFGIDVKVCWSHGVPFYEGIW